jgi:glycosyltransferase involved in cell wall biosynthesis
MERGGVETWLVQLLKHVDPRLVRMDFLVHTPDLAVYGDEVRSLGARIIVVPTPRSWFGYRGALRRAFERYGPWDIVHAHLHHFNGVVLEAVRNRCRVRIAHSHLDSRAVDGRARPLRRLYLRMMRHWIRAHATAGFAVSRDAAASLFGSAWMRDARWKILSCGIDLEPFSAHVDGATLRRQLGIRPDSVVLGHVGRFHAQKNHDMVIDIAADVFQREPRGQLLLVGSGERREAAEARARSCGIFDRTIFAGDRSDVPALMRGVMDVLIFPSRYEGLGLVVIEAQAAGLHSLISDDIPEEAILDPKLVRRLSRSLPIHAWGTEALEAAKAIRPTAREARDLVAGGPFDVKTSARTLLGAYRALA